MRTAAVLATLIALGTASAQDPSVDWILKVFVQRRAQARSAGEYKAIVQDTLAALDAAAAKTGAGHPDLPRAKFHAAEMLLNLEDPAGARTRLESFLQSFPDVPELSSTARYLCAETHLDLGDDAKARERFAAFVAKADPKDERVPRSRSLSALSYANEGKYDEAAKGLAELQKTNERTAIPLAIVHHLAEKHEDAHRTLQTLIKSSADIGTVELAKRLLSDWLGVGKPLPAWSGTDLAGSPVKTSAGKVSLICFFAAAYDESAVEARIIRRAAASISGEAPTVVGISIDKKRDDLDAFVKEHAIAWPVCQDGDGFDGPLARLFGVVELPRVMIVDRKGILRFVNPICTPYGRELRPLLEKLLAEK